MDRKDYEEPVCPMDNSMWVEKKVNPIPEQRVIAKEDEYLSKNDFDSALRHLLYWMEEAEMGNDERGKLLLCNELMGLYRKLGKADEAKEYAKRAVETAKDLGLDNTVSGATAYLNSGTVYKAFGDAEKSLECFEKAREVYERELDPKNDKMGGLYNNMALALTDLGRYEEAEELYMSAIDIMKEYSKADEAISWLNIADLKAAKDGYEKAEEEIVKCLDRADELLDEVPEDERDGYYAFVCEKCAPTFDYYGYFVSANKFKTRSKNIYEANRQ